MQKINVTRVPLFGARRLNLFADQWLLLELDFAVASDLSRGEINSHHCIIYHSHSAEPPT